jgi:hypothetical protein
LKCRKHRFFPVGEDPSVQSIAALRGYSDVKSAYLTGDIVGINGTRYSIHAVAISWKDEEGNRTTRMLPVARKFWVPAVVDAVYPYTISSPRGISTGALDTTRPWNTGTVAGCVALATPQESCICLAQLSFDSCIRQSQFSFAGCAALAIAAITAALWNCYFPVLGPFSILSCGVPLLIALAGLAWCNAENLRRIKGCYESLEIALGGCGISIFYLR